MRTLLAAAALAALVMAGTATAAPVALDLPSDAPHADVVGCLDFGDVWVCPLGGCKVIIFLGTDIVCVG